MHRLSRNPNLSRNSVTEAPANTARTASNRCSTTDNATSANPGLLSPTTSRNIVDQQAAPTAKCQALTDTRVSSTYRDRTPSHGSRLPNRALSGSRRGLPPRRSGARDPSTRESASTNGLPDPNHAQLAASYQRFTGFDGHNLTELRTDQAERDEDGVRFRM
jgi:hypothetical protein